MPPSSIAFNPNENTVIYGGVPAYRDIKARDLRPGHILQIRPHFFAKISAVNMVSGLIIVELVCQLEQYDEYDVSDLQSQLAQWSI